MKKQTITKLSLHRETLRVLERRELPRAAVGAGSTSACTYSGCQRTGCTCDTTKTYSGKQGHCTATGGFTIAF